MVIGKTDRRFLLYNHGFEYFVEFEFPKSFTEYLQTKKVCANALGTELCLTHTNRVIVQGDWHSTVHRKKRQPDTRRIYFKTRDHYLITKLSQPMGLTV